MSFTFTSTQERTTSESTVYLSPSKRKRSPSPVKTEHSAKEIYNWTFHADSVASCSVRDALEMPGNQVDRWDFYWLGSVPCRAVKIVGMVVGVQVYEKRILYTVDDGTAVIDCAHLNVVKPSAQPPKYIPNWQKLPMNAEPAAPPKPIAKVGHFVEVKGRIRPMHDSRQVTIDTIDLCSSNDELFHTSTVRELHRTLYSQTVPFVIPAHNLNKTPKKRKPPVTPSTMGSSPPSSISSSPFKLDSSPLKPEPLKEIHKSPIKLRHPSRLHTHDLTENTFRIYLKHYMDHPQDLSEAGYDSDCDIGDSLAKIPTTPTKGSQCDTTPRQSISRRNLDATPRPRIPPLNYGTGVASTSSMLHSSTILKDKRQRGFPLSYLRRVPELSLLASRVVQAVGRRRQREERQRMQAAGMAPLRTQKFKTTTSPIPPDKLAGKKKRLFQWAVVQLLKEGCIVLWDGPVRACPTSSMLNASRLWKANATLVDDSSLFSVSAGSLTGVSAADNDDDGFLSDPDPKEEAYISLTTEFLADFVENAIEVLVTHYEKMGKPYAGATKEGILAVLRKDDQWRYVGDWNVDDALELLKGKGRVWCMGKGRWDLTG